MPRTLFVIVIVLFSIACDREVVIPDLGDEKGALTEAHDGDYAVSWLVTADGAAKVGVTKDGKPVAPVRGDVRVKAIEDPENVKHELALADGLLTAEVGRLEEVTELRYRVEVDGRTLRGTLHLPAGGTAELVEEAKRHADADLAEEGPNGGVLQRVGDDVVEVIGHSDSGEVRVYVLDDDLQPVEVEDRSVRVVVDGEVVALKPAPAGGYFVGRHAGARAPAKVTLVVHHRAKTHVVICGHRPGRLIHPRHHKAVFVVRDWGPVQVRYHGRRGARARDRLLAGAGGAPGLHRRALRRGPGRDARRDGGARRRPGEDQPAAAGGAGDRPLGPGGRVRLAEAFEQRGARLRAQPRALRLPALGAARPSTTSRWCRRTPASCTR
jgi:hypothetical protein